MGAVFVVRLAFSSGADVGSGRECGALRGAARYSARICLDLRHLLGAVVVALAGGSALAAPQHASAWIAFSQHPVHAAAGTRQAPESGTAMVQTLMADRYASGSRLVLTRLEDPAGARRRIAPEFVAATDPCFSFDGKSLLFAGRRAPDEPFQIWRVDVEGGEPEPLFLSGNDCVQPIWLPDGRVAYASPAAGEMEEHGQWRSLSLYAFDPASGLTQRLTFNPSTDCEPAVLFDGRIVYAAWQHVGHFAYPTGRFALMTINSDGTGIWPLTGNHRAPWIKRAPAACSDHSVVFIESERAGEYQSGRLSRVLLDDPLGPYETLVPAGVADVAPLNETDLLLSLRPRAKQSPEGEVIPAASFGVYLLRGDEIVEVFDEVEFDELAIAATRRWPRIPGRVSVVVPEATFGFLAGLDVYRSTIPAIASLPRGTVSAVRIIEGVASWPGMAESAETYGAQGPPPPPTGYLPSRILGEVPVEEDGSFFARVPADRPIRLQLVDRNGFAVANQRAWIWVRPHERRVCIGCHENRELAPPNVARQAFRRPPTDVTDPAGWRTVSFRRDIEPILERSCALSACHKPPDPVAGLNLSHLPWPGDASRRISERYSIPYANLIRPMAGKPLEVGAYLVHPGAARESPLMWLLYGRQLGPQYAPNPYTRPAREPHPGPEPRPEPELEAFRLWIDLGATYDSPPGPPPAAPPARSP